MLILISPKHVTKKNNNNEGLDYIKMKWPKLRLVLSSGFQQCIAYIPPFFYVYHSVPTQMGDCLDDKGHRSKTPRPTAELVNLSKWLQQVLGNYLVAHRLSFPWLSKNTSWAVAAKPLLVDDYFYRGLYYPIYWGL